MRPSLKEEMKAAALWIHVGGNRRAGKTTFACALAVRLAMLKKKGVLLVSRKSVHTVSYIFNQEIPNIPIKVEGIRHLYALELDPKTPRKPLKRLTNKKRISERLGKRLFDSFHSWDYNINYAPIREFISEKKINFVVWDTAASVDSFGLWPFEKQSNFAKEEDDIKYHFVPKFKGTLFDLFDFNLCTKEIDKKLDTMINKYPHMTNVCENAFVFVDTVHPLSVAGNKILMSCLAQRGINIHLVVNRLSQEEPPRDVGNKNYICDPNLLKKHGAPLKLSLTKLPLWENAVKGVEEMMSFSQYLIEPYFKVPERVELE